MSSRKCDQGWLCSSKRCSRKCYRKKYEKCYDKRCDDKDCDDKCDDKCKVNVVVKTPGCEEKYVRASTAPGVPNNEFLSTLSYVGVEGPLENAFDPSTGIFTAPIAGIYHFAYNITWQNPNLTRNDGERYCQLLRTFATPRIENSFLGQYHSVPQQRVGLDAFYTLMSINPILTMEAGDTVQLAVYQNNSQEETIVAFTEFHILRSSKLDDDYVPPPTTTSSDVTIAGYPKICDKLQN